MKKLYLLFSFLLVYSVITAQTIVVSGACTASPITLSSTTPVNGQPAYTGSGTVAGSPNVTVSIYWMGAPDNLWVLAYDGQPYYSNACQTAAPPGTGNGSCAWVPVSGQPSPCASPAPLSLTGTGGALSVAFGTISAAVMDGALHVKWRTETEINNDHFTIEASKDGKEFATIGTVQSKAENGNSQSALEYEWVSDKALSFALIPLMAMALGLLGGTRRKKAAMLMLVAGLILLTNLGCNKHKDTVQAKGDYFIRIGQVDKDGTTSYSRTIKVNI